MGAIHARNGRLYAAIASGAQASPIGYVKSFELNFQTPKEDVTSFGDQNAVYVAGLPDASGSFSGFFNDVASADLMAAAQDGVARKFYFYPNTGTTTTYFFGTAFFDFSASFAVDSAGEVSGNWNAASTVARVG
jgi:hypothetical protein